MNGGRFWNLIFRNNFLRSKYCWWKYIICFENQLEKWRMDINNKTFLTRAILFAHTGMTCNHFEVFVGWIGVKVYPRTEWTIRISEKNDHEICQNNANIFELMKILWKWCQYSIIQSVVKPWVSMVLKYFLTTQRSAIELFSCCWKNHGIHARALTRALH